MPEPKKWSAIRSAIIITLSIFLSACADTPPPEDELYLGFQNPPAASRPFVRWWWNGNRVTAEETLRELDILRDAGIGGAEINAIAEPASEVDPDSIAPALEWLSPEWIQVVKATARGARERQMIADLIIGSGWPFGGRFLEEGEQLQLVTVLKEKVTGPGSYVKPLAELTQGTFRTWDPVHREEITSGSIPNLLFLRLVPTGATTVEPGLELVDSAVQEDEVRFDIPEGEFWLYAGSWREGFRNVELGAPGADGPVVDHFNVLAVRRYLDRVSGRLGPELGGQLGDHFRAVFCDSLELGEANWTGDFAEQFEKRRGYAPMPWLHYMTDPEQPKEEDALADTKRRLRYDFNLTIAELFQERFVQTLVDWAHTNGVQARTQAYGREAHPIDAGLNVDLPEGETWIWDNTKIPYPTANNRYVASAAHLAGRRIISAESMTNVHTVFRTLPYQLKQTGDLNFLSGITHFILHGYSYSPPEAGFPGWVRFGSYFNEKNSWWSYMRLWTDYVARVSWVLQNSEAQSRVAILSADADVWSDFGRPYYPFPEREAPGYVWRLWESLHRAGHNIDYVSDRILLEGVARNGALEFGSRRYEALLVPGLKRMPPVSAERLIELARAGVRIVFIERTPRQGPSYMDLGAGDERVRQAIATLKDQFSDSVWQVEAPPETDATEWAATMMSRSAVTPDVQFDPPSSQVSQIHHRDGSRDIFLIVHSGLNQAAEFNVTFPGIEGKTAWRWNPETGERRVFHAGNTPSSFDLRLEPLESLLLVFDDSLPDEADPVYADGPEAIPQVELKPQWHLHFAHSVTGETWEDQSTELFELGASTQPRVQNFAGTVTYSATVELEHPDWNWLDLGEVKGVSELWLNNQKVGVRWYGRHRYPISDLLTPGANHLEIRVTTHLGNYVRSLKDNAVAQRWARGYPLESTGLIGPLSLH